MALDGEPRLKAIHIASPGWIEALGKLNPLGACVQTVLNADDLNNPKIYKTSVI